MPYQFDWDDREQTIIRLEMFGEVTWQQYHRVIGEIAEIIHKRSPQHIGLILHERTPMPKGNVIANLKNSLDVLSTLGNLRRMVVVTEKGVPKLAQPFMRIVNETYHFDFHLPCEFVQTLEEAREILCNARSRA